MIRALVGIMVGALVAASAGAQTDHLECFKVKDSSRKARYVTSLVGLAPAAGCVIKVPARLMCVAAAQPAMTPTPPGTTAGADAGAFLCYKVRCRRNALAATTVTDEFGQRLVRPRRSRLLCAPLAGSATTTSTTLAAAHCDVPATTCGSCGNGSCQPIRPSGELICAFQTQGFCVGSCQSTADCTDGRFCVGASGNSGTCCSPCS